MSLLTPTLPSPISAGHPLCPIPHRKLCLWFPAECLTAPVSFFQHQSPTPQISSRGGTKKKGPKCFIFIMLKFFRSPAPPPPPQPQRATASGEGSRRRVPPESPPPASSVSQVHMRIALLRTDAGAGPQVTVDYRRRLINRKTLEVHLIQLANGIVGSWYVTWLLFFIDHYTIFNDIQKLNHFLSK